MARKQEKHHYSALGLAIAACAALPMFVSANDGHLRATHSFDSHDPLSYEPPSHETAFEVSADFASRQLSYGLVDNRAPVLTFCGAAEWRGFFLEAEIIFDTTRRGETHGGYGNRKWRYKEIAFGPGYAHTLEDFLSAPVELSLAYSYVYNHRRGKNHGHDGEFRDTQYINIGLKFPELPFSLGLFTEIDTDDEAGALYIRLDGEHAFPLLSSGKHIVLGLSLSAGIGVGNPMRNRGDADLDRWAFKDVCTTAALLWQPAKILSIAPYISVSEQLDGNLRAVARETSSRSTQLIGGFVVNATF